MGSNDIPPPHVPSHVVPTCNTLLQVGGVLWTLCYILLARESLRSKSYGMPLFAIALNFAWEVVFAFLVAESPLEQVIFTIWVALDLVMVYGMVKYGKHEWSQAPIVARNLGWIFLVLTTYCALGHWTFAKWWLDNDMGKREGKFYRGVLGPDTTELGFWSGALCQAYLSAASLVQLLIRGHTGGVSWSVWATRNLGSIIGMYMYYGWAYYYWKEAHEYFLSPFAIFLWCTGLVCDLIYPFVFYRIRKTEKVLPDGRKVRGAILAQKKE